MIPKDFKRKQVLRNAVHRAHISEQICFPDHKCTILTFDPVYISSGKLKQFEQMDGNIPNVSHCVCLSSLYTFPVFQGLSFTLITINEVVIWLRNTF